MNFTIRHGVRLGLLGVSIAVGSGIALWGSPMAPNVPADPPKALPSATRVYAIRLTPGQDMKKELLAFARREDLKAPAILTCVGSLTEVTLRFANQQTGVTRKGHFEIVSLVGMLDQSGGHVHLCVADKDGVAFGGHLLDGCVVYTTAEVVITELVDVEFKRELDKTFGYKELVISPRHMP